MSGNFGARAIWKHFGSGVGLFLTEMPEMKMAKKNFLHMTHRVSGDLRGGVAYLCAIWVVKYIDDHHRNPNPITEIILLSD